MSMHIHNNPRAPPAMVGFSIPIHNSNYTHIHIQVNVLERSDSHIHNSLAQAHSQSPLIARRHYIHFHNRGMLNIRITFTFRKCD